MAGPPMGVASVGLTEMRRPSVTMGGQSMGFQDFQGGQQSMGFAEIRRPSMTMGPAPSMPMTPAMSSPPTYAQPGYAPPPSGGFKVDQVEMPYTPADADHMKQKPLDYGGGGYEFSSPFAFSQGDDGTASSSVAQMASAGTSSLPPMQIASYQGGCPGGPGMQMVTEIVTNVQVQDVAPNMHGFSQNVSQNISSRPGMGGPPPGYGQYPPQGFPPGYGQPGPWQQPGYGPPPGYGGPPPGYQQGPPQQPQGLPNGGKLEGWLAKRSDGGIASAWNMRWWRLEGGAMAYARDERGSEAGRIQLTAKTEVRPLQAPNATVEGRMMGSKKPHAFELYQGPSMRTYYLDAGSMEKKNLWMGTIQAVVGQLRQSQWPHGGPPGGFR